MNGHQLYHRIFFPKGRQVICYEVLSHEWLLAVSPNIFFSKGWQMICYEVLLEGRRQEIKTHQLKKEVTNYSRQGTKEKTQNHCNNKNMKATRTHKKAISPKSWMLAAKGKTQQNNRATTKMWRPQQAIKKLYHWNHANKQWERKTLSKITRKNKSVKTTRSHKKLYHQNHAWK